MAPAEKHQANARASAKKGKVFHEDCQFYWNNMVICDADQYFSLDGAQQESGGARWRLWVDPCGGGRPS